MKVKFSELEFALEFSSFDSYDNDAYLCTKTGKIYYDSDFLEEPLPDDIDENESYLVLPSKRDLDLGKRLVMSFIAEYLPEEVDKVNSMFRAKGAYSRYKPFLEDRELIDKWYEYEQAAEKKALLEWCQVNDLETDI